MNEILDKLGIYDLIGVLLPGICISTFSLCILRYFNLEQLISLSDFKISETVSFLIISYFLGVIFQELGSLVFNRMLHKNQKYLSSVLHTSKNNTYSLTREEIEGIFYYVGYKLNLQNPFLHYDDVYNYCRFQLSGTDQITKSDKDLSISGMSRSLSLYFFVAPILLYILPSVRTQLRSYLLLLITSFAISFILYWRYVRFVKMRYVKIFRAFYYNIILK